MGYGRDWTVVTDDERYAIRDAVAGPYTVSNTVLRAGQATRGHAHERDEVYVFSAGIGLMTIGDQRTDVGAGRVVYVGPNEYHRVENMSETDALDFLSFFVGPPGRPEVTHDG